MLPTIFEKLLIVSWQVGELQDAIYCDLKFGSERPLLLEHPVDQIVNGCKMLCVSLVGELPSGICFALRENGLVVGFFDVAGDSYTDSLKCALGPESCGPVALKCGELQGSLVRTEAAAGWVPV